MNKHINGFSLIEILVVVSIFAVIGVLTSQAVISTLKSGKKSDSLIRVRENINYSLAIIERQIRNSESISPCLGDASSTLSYISIEGIPASFTCSGGYIASGSGRLTTDDILVTACSFTCTKLDENNPAIVKVNISAEDATSTSEEKGSVSSDIEIVTRNY